MLIVAVVNTTLLSLVLVFVVNKLVGVVNKTLEPPVQINQLPEPVEEEVRADEWSGSKAVYLPDVEMDEWINEHGMPMTPGWSTNVPNDQ